MRRHKTDISECRAAAQVRGYECLSDVIHNQHEKLRWKCLSCGREWLATFDHIKRTSGCPYCRRRYGDMESRCRVILEAIFKKPFDRCRPFTNLGSRLEIDCYNEELKLAVEYDGLQHRLITSFRTKENGRSIWEKDREKNLLCEQLNIRLIRVRDTEASTETIADVLIGKLRRKGIAFDEPDDVLLSALRNPTDVLYRRVYGSDYLKRLREVCERKGGRLLDSVWAGTDQKYNLRCGQGHAFRMSYESVVRGGGWCTTCSGRHPVGIPFCRATALARGGECLSTSYRNNEEKLLWRCGEGHEWRAAWISVMSSWCPVCGRKRGGMRRRVGIERCQQVARERGGVCVSKEYVTAPTPILWRCNKHDFTWAARPADVINAGNWCPKCKSETIAAKVRQRAALMVNIERCRETAIARGGVCLSNEYTRSNKKMMWRCSEGHEWQMPWNSVQSGQWCPVCGKRDAARRRARRMVDIGRCRSVARERGGECLSAEFIDSGTKMRWRCSEGHEWTTMWNKIQQGNWCPVCAGVLPFKIDVCKEHAGQLGGNCLSTEYVNCRTKLRWICTIGHEWCATWDNIKHGHWCPICGRRKALANRKMKIVARSGERLVQVDGHL